MVKITLRKDAAMAELQDSDLYDIQVRQQRTYCIFTVDPEGYITSWNAGVEALLGYSEDEWIGKNCEMVFTPEDLAAHIPEQERRTAAEAGTASDVRWHVHKDGTRLFANGVMNSIWNSRGEVIGYSKMISDETARKQLQDSLAESNAALEQFAYVASHDLQEPLRTITGFSQLLMRRRGEALDEEARGYVELITKASTRMRMLIEDLLSYARVVKEEERSPVVPLDDHLEAALSHLSQAIMESGAAVTHDPMPIALVDRGQIIRLFQNLIGNSLKYHKPGEPPRVHIAVKRQDENWVFSVKDNGIGFDPQFASDIFMPFRRLHNNGEYSGTGVGLAICSRIVQSHGGKIWAESEPNQGTTIYFTLPVQEIPNTRPAVSPGSTTDTTLGRDQQ